MSSRDLIRDVARELQDGEHVRWSQQDLADYANQTLFEMVRHRPDISATTRTLCLTQGTRQSVPADCVQLMQLTRNAPDGRAIRYVHKESMDAVLPAWHGRSPSKTIHDYCWREDEPGVFHVYPPASDEARVEAVVAQRPMQIDPPRNTVDWEDPDIEELTRRDAQWLVSALAVDLMAGRGWTMRSFTDGLFDEQGNPVFRPEYRCSFLAAWGYLEQAVKDLAGDSDGIESLELLLETARNVIRSPEAYRGNAPVVPESIPEADPSEEGFTALVSAAFDSSLLDGMWQTLLDDENSECGTDIDWEAGQLEDFTRRDGQYLLLALARDLRHGNDKTTRTFVEYLFNDDGSLVFDEQMRCGFELSWDYLVGELESELSAEDHQRITDLVQLVKDTLDKREPGLVRVKTPDRSAEVEADQALADLLIDRADQLVEIMWQDLVRNTDADCPDGWPALPIPLHWRDTLMDGILARAMARNTDAASIEKARYHWQRFEMALGVQRNARMSFRPGPRARSPQPEGRND